MILSSLVMLLGAFSGGTMLGFSSPLIPGIRNDTKAGINVTDSEASWIGVSTFSILVFFFFYFKTCDSKSTQDDFIVSAFNLVALLMSR